jgi:hypothetical protein
MIGQEGWLLMDRRLGGAMPAIIEFPTVVQKLLAEYGDLFANVPSPQNYTNRRTHS